MDKPLATPSQIEEFGRLIRKIEHPNLTEDEALEIEAEYEDCLCEFVHETPGGDVDGGIATYYKVENTMMYTRCTKILGLKITLPRILAAMQKKLHVRVSTGDFEGCEEDKMCIKEEYHVMFEFRKILYMWDKMQDNSQLECTAEHQTEETILALIKILL